MHYYIPDYVLIIEDSLVVAGNAFFFYTLYNIANEPHTQIHNHHMPVSQVVHDKGFHPFQD
jgi:hypothetical protein